MFEQMRKVHVEGILVLLSFGGRKTLFENGTCLWWSGGVRGGLRVKAGEGRVKSSRRREEGTFAAVFEPAAA